MITDRDDALNAAARAICIARSDDPALDESYADAFQDAAETLDAIGFDELVASRERAIVLAVQLEEQAQFEFAMEMGSGAEYTDVWTDIASMRAE
jgi:hypothetical protein